MLPLIDIGVAVIYTFACMTSRRQMHGDATCGAGGVVSSALSLLHSSTVFLFLVLRVDHDSCLVYNVISLSEERCH